MRWNRAILALLVVASGTMAWCERSMAGAVRVRPPASRTIRELVTGSGQACVVYTDGTLACWSLADRTGRGDPIEATAPRRALRVPGITGATSVALSPLHGCALEGAGHVDCWSYSDIDVSRPFAAVRVNVIPPLSKLSTHTEGSVMCGTDLGERDWCWHSFARRDWFGDPTMSYSRAGSYRSAVETSRRHTCAFWSDARVECWEEGSTTTFAVVLP